MTEQRESACPGCGIQMPISMAATTHRYINASPECWGVFAEVLATEYADAILFQQVHQLTVDSYVAQHPGGGNPDKSIGIHLCGLHLVLDHKLPSSALPQLRQSLAEGIEAWPHLPPPVGLGSVTVWDVAVSDSSEEHAEAVRRSAQSVWQAWRAHHHAIGVLVEPYLGGS